MAAIPVLYFRILYQIQENVSFQFPVRKKRQPTGQALRFLRSLCCCLISTVLF